MQRKPTIPQDSDELRRRAEDRVESQRLENRPQRLETDAQRAIHELHVHQIELEMQNEELRHSRNEMEALLERYTELYEFAPVSYFSLDEKSRILKVNLTGAALLGANRAQLIQQHLSCFLTPESRPGFSTFLENVFARPERQACEMELLQGKNPPVVVRVEAEMTASKSECRAVIENITSLKQAEKDRLILNKLESTGILAGGIAHDFNNLLTVISLNLELARELTPPEGDLGICLAVAEKTALMASGLTHQLITFSEGGAPVLKSTRLTSIIRESAQAALSGSRTQCFFSLADDLWPVDADARQIEQVIRNLVLNAREAMPQGGMVVIQAENVIPTSRKKPSRLPGRCVRIRITDQGGGIAKEVLPKIFDPYFSTKERGTQKGMGLGLTICHAIVTKHKGTLAVESASEAGATFAIHLPASQAVTEKETPPMSVMPSQQMKILVMDDESSLRGALGLLLKTLGHDVELTAEGKKAVDVYDEALRQGNPFDIVILDLTVRDGMGGLDAIQELLKIDPSVTAIVMSGYADDPALLDPARYGFKGSLRKPFDSDNLKTILSQTVKGCPGSMSRHE